MRRLFRTLSRLFSGERLLIQAADEAWCPGFVPWSCWGHVDEDFNRCDICGCRREDHPVMTREQEDRLQESYPCGLDDIHQYVNGNTICECGEGPPAPRVSGGREKE